MNRSTQQRISVLLAVLAMALGCLGTQASAEVLRTNTTAKLRAKPGDRARVVAELGSGQEVEVITRSGRWIRVKSGEQVGWLARTKVRPVEVEAPKERPSTRVELWRRKGGMDDASATRRPADTKRMVKVVGGGQKAYREPTGKSRVAFTAPEDSVLTVVGDDKEGTWLLVENELGHLGWMPAMVVAPASNEDVESARFVRRDLAESTRTWEPERAFSPNLVAGIGYRNVGMDFTSNGTAGLGNYIVSAPAAAALLGASVPLVPRSSQFMVSVDGEYRLTYSNPGIRYQSSAGPTGDIGFAMHDVHAGGQLGYKLSEKTLTLAARVGYHFGVFYVNDIDNVGRMARESLQGLRMGGRAVYAPRTSAYVVRGGFDVLTSALRKQTPGLEDGMSSTTSGLFGHVGFDYPIASHFNMTAQYSYERAATEWNGQSARQADVTEASRVDQSHTVYLGMARSF